MAPDVTGFQLKDAKSKKGKEYILTKKDEETGKIYTVTIFDTDKDGFDAHDTIKFGKDSLSIFKPEDIKNSIKQGARSKPGYEEKDDRKVDLKEIAKSTDGKLNAEEGTEYTLKSFMEFNKTEDAAKGNTDASKKDKPADDKKAPNGTPAPDSGILDVRNYLPNMTPATNMSGMDGLLSMVHQSAYNDATQWDANGYTNLMCGADSGLFNGVSNDFGGGYGGYGGGYGGGFFSMFGGGLFSMFAPMFLGGTGGLGFLVGGLVGGLLSNLFGGSGQEQYPPPQYYAPPQQYYAPQEQAPQPPAPAQAPAQALAPEVAPVAQAIPPAPTPAPVVAPATAPAPVEQAPTSSAEAPAPVTQATPEATVSVTSAPAPTPAAPTSAPVSDSTSTPAPAKAPVSQENLAKKFNDWQNKATVALSNNSSIEAFDMLDAQKLASDLVDEGDTNNDAKLSVKEITKQEKNRAAALNISNKISDKEIDAGMKIQHETMNVNNEGSSKDVVDKDEYEATLRAADTNNDGKLSQEEYANMSEKTAGKDVAKRKEFQDKIRAEYNKIVLRDIGSQLKQVGSALASKFKAGNAPAVAPTPAPIVPPTADASKPAEAIAPAPATAKDKKIADLKAKYKALGDRLENDAALRDQTNHNKALKEYEQLGDEINKLIEEGDKTPAAPAVQSGGSDENIKPDEKAGQPSAEPPVSAAGISVGGGVEPVIKDEVPAPAPAPAVAAKTNTAQVPVSQTENYDAASPVRKKELELLMFQSTNDAAIKKREPAILQAVKEMEQEIADLKANPAASKPAQEAQNAPEEKPKAKMISDSDLKTYLKRDVYDDIYVSLIPQQKDEDCARFASKNPVAFDNARVKIAKLDEMKNDSRLSKEQKSKIESVRDLLDLELQTGECLGYKVSRDDEASQLKVMKKVEDLFAKLKEAKEDEDLSEYSQDFSSIKYALFYRINKTMWTLNTGNFAKYKDKLQEWGKI